MRFAAGFIVGFALCIYGFNKLESWTYTRAMASFTCGVFGRESVWIDLDQGVVCADLSDAYPSSYALDLIVARFYQPKDGPR